MFRRRAPWAQIICARQDQSAQSQERNSRANSYVPNPVLSPRWRRACKQQKQNKEETPMNYPAAIATLVLATTTALPAFAATPIMTPLRDAAATSIEMVQYQKAAPHQRVHHTTAHRNGANDPLNAHAAAPGANTPANGTSHCVDGLEGSASSAYPMWELCH
jgi:hypothetical protein